MATTAKMTAAEAVTFAGFSVANAARVAHELSARGCGCEPYQDVYTYRRWTAQGRHVRKGEHGIALPVIVDAAVQGDDEEDAKPIRLRRTSYVFCRCQTEGRTTR